MLIQVTLVIEGTLKMGGKESVKDRKKAEIGSLFP